MLTNRALMDMATRAGRFAFPLLGVLGASLQVACPGPAVMPDASARDAGADASANDDAPMADAGPTYPIDYACTAPCGIRWRELAPFDRVIDHHTTFIIERTDGAYLYVLGGVEPDPLGETVVSYNDRISAAKIQADGTLGPWEHHDFRYGIAFHGQTQYHPVDTPTSTIVAWSGGLLHPSTDTDLAPAANPYTFAAEFAMGAGPGLDRMFPGMGGDVATTTGDLTEAVLHGTLHRRLRDDGTRGDFFFVGGGAGSALSSATRRYELSTEMWATDTALPGPRSHHALVEIDRHMYVLGGFSGTVLAPVGEPAILRSTHDAEGHVTGWENVGTMDEPPWTTAAFVRDNFIYVVGGGISGGHHGDGEFLDRVRRAPIMADGHIGAFVDLNGHLPVARSHVHQTPVYGNYVYSVGGRVREGSTLHAQNRIFVGTFE